MSDCKIIDPELLEKFSYSKLETYENCAFAYYLKYVLKYDSFSQTVATEIGTLIHETEEEIAKALINKQSIDYIKLKNNVILKSSELAYKYGGSYTELDKTSKTYHDKITYYLNYGIYELEKFMKEHPTYTIVGIELPILFTYNSNYSFRGFVDRIFYDTATETYIIQDIKTWPQIDGHDLKTPLQFVIYSLAVSKIFNCSLNKIKCQYYLPFITETHNAGTNGYVDRGCVKINKLFAAIEAKEFKCKPSPLCFWCQFCKNNNHAPENTKYLCPYYSHWTRQVNDFSTENKWQGLDNHQLILENYHKKYGVQKDYGSK